jgi:hypothetical protein
MSRQASRLTAIARQTTADKLVHPILARSSVLARTTGTLVHVAEAARIIVTPRTLALEAVHKVHTNAAIGTRIAGTFIDIGFTVLSSEPRNTVARIPAHKTSHNIRTLLQQHTETLELAALHCIGYTHKIHKLKYPL